MEASKAQEKETYDDIVKKLGTLTEALTHSGSNTLDEEVFKQVKKICKSSQCYIPQIYNFILNQLKKKNSQIRFLAFQMCKELFTRSTVFREHVIKNLELIFKLTAGINSKVGLPPPKSVAENLKALAVKTLQQWVDDFGVQYKQLTIAYNYFKNCKHINFENVDTRTQAERIRSNENEGRLRGLFEERVKFILNEIKSYKSEIEETITSLSNCVQLLMPTPEDFFVSESSKTPSMNLQEKTVYSALEEDEEEISHADLRRFGITMNYSLKLNINPNEKIKILKTDENSSIIQNAKDCVQLINNRFLPLIKKWSLLLCKYSSNGRDGKDLKQVLDLREKLLKILEKYRALNIEDKASAEHDSNYLSDDDDGDLEEVTKDGYEDSVEFSEEDLLLLSGTCKTPKNITDLEKSDKDHAESYCSSNKRCRENTPPPGTSNEDLANPANRKSKLMKIAPKLPYDIDLYHWEDETLTIPTLISTKMDVDKFWGCAGSDEIHEIPNPEGTASLRTRVIEFSGKFEPVKWTCRAPLPSGKLCPRKDRFKCPFHGKIVPRDENGICQNAEDDKSNKGQSSSESSTVPDWQDPKLLAEIKESTGIDLKLPEGRTKRNKSKTDNLTHKQMKTSPAALKIAKSKNYPGLIDVVKRQNNTYTRLSKKLFNKSTMRRVSAALNKLDKKKFNDKFGDCFNY